MHLITFLQKKFAEVRTILTCYACNEGYLFFTHF